MSDEVKQQTVEKRRVGRPTIFTEDHPCWVEIFDGVSSGLSLTTMLKRPNMPTYMAVMKIMRARPEMRALYDKACEDRADKLAEEILELSDAVMPEGFEGAQASAWVQQKRLQVDARKWVASKLYSKRYGDRVDVSVTDTRISVMDALNEAKQRVLKDESNVVDVVDVVVKDTVDKSSE